MLWRGLPIFKASIHFLSIGKMATDDSTPGTPLVIRTQSSSSQQQSQDNGSDAFDIVKTYHDLLNSDADITMPVAAIESLIELLRVTPSSTAMETVEIVKKEKQRLLDSAPNPLPLLAGADLFEQTLLRSLRGQTVGATDRVLSFEETRQHLLQNRQLFAQRAKAARDNIAIHGARYVLDGKVVLAAGGSRAVTKILLHAATDPKKHFKVIYVVDGSPRAQASVDALRAAGLDVSTIGTHRVSSVLRDQGGINLVLVGTEVVLQNGGIISRMGTHQLAVLTKHVKSPYRRLYVAAETHKIVRKTCLMYPPVQRVGIKQRDLSKFKDIGVAEITEEMLAEDDEVDYVEPDLIAGIITEQGVKMPSQIWEMVDYN